MVRAKFRVVSVTKSVWNADQVTVKMSPMYEQPTEENISFSKATPSGSIELDITNPAASEQLTLGAYFYVDFTPAE